MFWQRDVKNSILAGKFSLVDGKNLASLKCLHKLIPMSQLKYSILQSRLLLSADLSANHG